MNLKRKFLSYKSLLLITSLLLLGHQPLHSFSYYNFFSTIAASKPKLMLGITAFCGALYGSFWLAKLYSEYQINKRLAALQRSNSIFFNQVYQNGCAIIIHKSTEKVILLPRTVAFGFNSIYENDKNLVSQNFANHLTTFNYINFVVIQPPSLDIDNGIKALIASSPASMIFVTDWNEFIKAIEEGTNQ
jgi:hypothetical protein